MENEVNLEVNRNQSADNSVSTESIKNQSEIQWRSARAQTLTEKGQVYQEERQKEKEREDHLTKKFNETYNTWEAYAAEVESFLGSPLPSSQEEKIEKISNLNGLCDNVHKAYEKLREVRLPRQELLRKVDTCDALNQSLQQQLDVQSSNEQSRNHDDERSVRSRLSRRSGASRSSRTSSIIGLKKADVAVELRGGFRGGLRGLQPPLLWGNFFLCKQRLSDGTSCFVTLDIFSVAPDDCPCHKCNCGT